MKKMNSALKFTMVAHLAFLTFTIVGLSVYLIATFSVLFVIPGILVVAVSVWTSFYIFSDTEEGEDIAGERALAKAAIRLAMIVKDLDNKHFTVHIDDLSTGVAVISAERARHFLIEGFSEERDDKYSDDELARAAAMYALPVRCRSMMNTNISQLPSKWPWHQDWWKPTPKDCIRELAKAGALIAAEIDRLQRKKQKQTETI